VASPVTPLVRSIACVECGRVWVLPIERWRIYLTDDDPPNTPRRVLCRLCPSGVRLAEPREMCRGTSQAARNVPRHLNRNRPQSYPLARFA
jgi:hypothetical protein